MVSQISRRCRRHRPQAEESGEWARGWDQARPWSRAPGGSTLVGGLRGKSNSQWSSYRYDYFHAYIRDSVVWRCLRGPKRDSSTARLHGEDINEQRCVTVGTGGGCALCTFSPISRSCCEDLAKTAVSSRRYPFASTPIYSIMFLTSSG